MKNTEIKFPQDSDLWHSWRNGGIGASEASILMGSLPFKFNDVLELWKLKSGLKESDFVMNDAMALGKALEPEARKKYIIASGKKVVPKCYQNELPFIRASLDGITKDGSHIVEIKVQGLSKWKLAKQGIMSEYYYPQIQQQLLCTGATSAHFWTYRKDEGGVLINVPRNDSYIEELVRRCKIFWNCVEEKTPCLPHMLGIDMTKDSDPFEAGDMTTELIGVYKN